MPRSRTRRQQPVFVTCEPCRLDPLEARQLMTAYTPTPIGDYYAIPGPELFTLAAPAGSVGFGTAGVLLGDVDDDGATDFAVSAPGRPQLEGVGPEVTGAVYVYSGKTHALITTIAGNAQGFGLTLTLAGDRDADGVSELLIGNPRSATVVLYSVTRREIFHTYQGDLGSEYGYSIAVLDDLNADGKPDFAFGAPLQDEMGAVFIVSGFDGTTIRRIDGTQLDSRFGHSVIAFRDETPTDGIREIVIGAPDHDAGSPGQLKTDAGAYFVVNPVTGAQVTSYVGEWVRGHVGYSLAADATSTLYIGAPSTNAQSGNYEGGWVMQATSALGAPLTMWGSRGLGDRFGVAIRVAPVLNGASGDIVYISTGSGITYSPYGAFGETRISAGEVLIGDLDDDGVLDALGLRWTSPVADVRAVSALSIFTPIGASVFSRDGAYAVGGGAVPTSPGSSQYKDHWVATRDSFFLLGPTIGRDLRITAISNDGMLAGYNVANQPFITRINGTGYHLISDLVSTIAGPTPTYTNMRVVFFGPGGDIFLTEETSSDRTRAWRLSGGTLRHLWNGIVTDQAADGTLIGVDIDYGAAVIWAPADAGPEPIPGLADVWQFSPDGSILGRSQNGELTLLRNGVYTKLRAPLQATGDTFVGWSPIGVDSAGRALYQSLTGQSYHFPGDRGSPPRDGVTWRGETQFLDVNGAPYAVRDRVDSTADPTPTFGLPTTSSFTEYPTGGRRAIAFTADGRILTPTYVLEPNADLLQGITAATVGAAPSSTGAPVTLGVTSGGMPFTLRLGSDGQWISKIHTEIDQAWSTGVYTDPKDNQTYVVAFGRQVVNGATVYGVIYRQLADGSLTSPQVILSNAEDAIRRQLIVFFSAPDNRVHVAGMSSANGLVMYYQNGARFADKTWAWAADNISANHLFPQGITTTGWTQETNLTPYVTPWGGLNIAGLDFDGHVQVVWWAPTMTYWTMDDLTENTGMPTLAGSLTSYVTSWGGLNVAGVDANGDLQVAWWVPGFGDQWRKDNMTEQLDGIKITGASAYVTPWGGLNIAGIDTVTGRPAVYWWTVGMDDWVSQLIEVKGGTDDSPYPTGAMVPVILGSQLNRIGTSGADEVVRLFWNPGDGDVWNLDNVAALAV